MGAVAETTKVPVRDDAAFGAVVGALMRGEVEGLHEFADGAGGEESEDFAGGTARGENVGGVGADVAGEGVDALGVEELEGVVWGLDRVGCDRGLGGPGCAVEVGVRRGECEPGVTCYGGVVLEELEGGGGVGGGGRGELEVVDGGVVEGSYEKVHDSRAIFLSMRRYGKVRWKERKGGRRGSGTDPADG